MKKILKQTKKFYLATGIIYLILLVIFSCTKPELKFIPVSIADKANLWWARAPADINEDGRTDLVLQDNNGHGGWLGWLEATEKDQPWKLHIIAETAPGGGTFACGDMDAGDIDGDGDIDILGFEHPGEWDSAGTATQIYWYNNPDWTPTFIGSAPDFTKDINLADLNADHKPDLVAITYEENKMVIYRQDSPLEWIKVLDTVVVNLHEGMDVGDIDGDTDIDIAANGYWVENPGQDMEGTWMIHSINEKWNNQNGDWSKNATKVFCRDITGDGKAEVFITHSERNGYPVAWYHSDDPRQGNWTEHIIRSDFPAAHTLQVFDFNLDGDYDVLAGVNKNRAKALQVETFPVIIFLNDNNESWEEFLITDEGIYNGQVYDLEGDGDLDIFRLPTHDDTYFVVLVNQIR